MADTFKRTRALCPAIVDGSPASGLAKKVAAELALVYPGINVYKGFRVFMLPYWVLYLIPALGLLSGQRLTPSSQRVIWGLLGVVFALAIGLRHEVGGDWGAYLGYLERASLMTLPEVLFQGDPGYYLVNWIGATLGGDIYVVNVMCGAILMSGVVLFARRQPLSLMALLVAVPYLITVVGMGYTRQAVALGFILLGLSALTDGRTRSFVVWVLIGAAFHKSAVLILPVAALATTQRRIWNLFWIGIVSLMGGYLFLFDTVDTLWSTYVENDIESQGGLIRVLMNAVPAVLYLLMHRYLVLEEEARRLWWWMSVFALACIPLVLISSTATDRVALYLIPLQLFVFSRLHLITNDTLLRAYIVTGVIVYYTTVLAVWLFFATHSHAWLPYQMYPFAS